MELHQDDQVSETSVNVNTTVNSPSETIADNDESDEQSGVTANKETFGLSALFELLGM
jgi:hypothetical protein